METTKVDRQYLERLKSNPGISSVKLAEVMGKNKTTVASRLSIMFAAGLLTRTQVALPLRGMEFRYSVKGEQVRAPTVWPTPRKEEPMTRENQKPVSAEVEKQTEQAVRGELPPPAEIKPDAALSLLLNKFVESLADEVVARLRPALVERLTTSVGTMTEEITRAIPRKEKAKLRRVLVCGCLDRQGQMLKQEYDGMLEIDWVTVECSTEVWKNKARNAYAVLVMADFVSHKHIDMIKETGAEPEVHKGGYSRLRDRLIELSIN